MLQIEEVEAEAYPFETGEKGSCKSGLGRIVVVPVIERTQQLLPDIIIPVGVIHDIPIVTCQSVDYGSRYRVNVHANSFKTKTVV